MMSLVTEYENWIYAYRIPVELQNVDESGAAKLNTDWCLVKVGQTGRASLATQTGIQSRLYDELNAMKIQPKPAVPANARKRSRAEELAWAVDFPQITSLDYDDMLFFCQAPPAAEPHLRWATGYPFGKMRSGAVWSFLLSGWNPTESKQEEAISQPSKKRPTARSRGENQGQLPKLTRKQIQVFGATGPGSGAGNSLHRAATLDTKGVHIRVKHFTTADGCEAKQATNMGQREWVLCPSSACHAIQDAFRGGKFGGAGWQSVASMYENLWATTWGAHIPNINEDSTLRVIASIDTSRGTEYVYLDHKWEHICKGTNLDAKQPKHVPYFDILQSDELFKLRTYASMKNAVKAKASQPALASVQSVGKDTSSPPKTPRQRKAPSTSLSAPARNGKHNMKGKRRVVQLAASPNAR